MRWQRFGKLEEYGFDPVLASIFSLRMDLLHFLALFQVTAATATGGAIRINQLGYLPDAPKVAVLCALEKVEVHDFTVTDSSRRVVLRKNAALAKPFGPWVSNY